MVFNVFRVLISVKAKLFFGFLAMTMIILLLGGYAFVSIGNAGVVVKDTFDRPLMAINFSRSAGQVFNDLEIEVLRQSTRQTTRQAIRQANRAQSGPALDMDAIVPLVERFQDDIAVARERSISAKATTFFDEADRLFAEWKALVYGASAATPESLSRADAVASRIKDQLEIIVELQAGEAFLAREAAITDMAAIKRLNVLAGAVGLAVTLLLSAWIAVTIISPLKAAADAARRISGGDFQTDIPSGGDDETGVLLKTLSAMQANIRDRMAREETLRTLAQHRLSDSVGNSDDAILLTDARGVIIVANPKMGVMFPALAGTELVNRFHSQLFTQDGATLHGDCVFMGESNEIRFGDGRWARVSASTTQEGGRLYIWSDITEAKTRSQHLREAKNAAEAADKAKTLFLATMSHELRTPLNAVIGFSDILVADNSASDGNPAHARLAGLISQSGAQLLNIVKDVLNVANGDRAGMTAEFGEVDLNDVVRFSLDTVASEAAAKGVRLFHDCVATPPVVRGDVLRLQQLLLNLLSNAIKYNEAGGVVQVRVSEEPAGEIHLDVIDNGIGIDNADIQRIMQPFVQVDDGSTRKYDGVGLGLTIVQRILDIHGGRILIRSALGQGTYVRIVLPSLTRSNPPHARRAA